VHTGSPPAERGPLPVVTKKRRLVSVCSFLEPHSTKECTIYPGIQGLYRRLIYTCVLPDRGTISAIPRYKVTYVGTGC
jgi:hypothetical protein